MKPIIYQLFPRTFSNYNETRKHNGTKAENGCGTFNGITPAALRAIQKLGITHVWYTGVIRHATAEYNTPSIVKGLAGSPYAITDYYDVDPDLATVENNRMAEFESLIRRTHKQGLKVVIDFVPNHVAREYKSACKPKDIKDLGEGDHSEWAFSPLNNFYYVPGEKFSPTFDIGDYYEFPAKVTGNDCFTAHPSRDDWYETVKLNYGVFYLGGGEKQFSPLPSTWFKMMNILMFWAKKGVDAFRVDMAEMVPIEFWQWVIEYIHTSFPKIDFIGEVYNPLMYRDFIRAGFSYLYDKVGMYDYLRGVITKGWAAEGITRHWQEVDDIQDHMLYFLENHDEQRIASGFFCGRGSNAEPGMIVAATLGRNPLLIWAGQELGEKGMDGEGFSGIDGRTSIFDYWGVRSLQAWANNGKFDGKNLNDEQASLRKFYQRLLTVARDHSAVNSGLKYDLEYAQGEGFDKHEQYVYLRKSDDELLLIVTNFDDKEREITITIPEEAFHYMQFAPLPNATAKDLLTDTFMTFVNSKGKKQRKFSFAPGQPITITLPAWKGAIYQIISA